MTRYIAFLRAINVGGRVVKMDRLRAALGVLGFATVSLFTASGTIVSGAAEEDPVGLERRIEDRLRQTLGYEVATFLRTASELAAIAAHRPFPDQEHQSEAHSLYVMLLRGPLGEQSIARLLSLRSEADDLHVNGREVYWLCRVPFAESPLARAPLEKTTAMPSTTRNVTTLRKMAAKYAIDAR